MAEYPQEILTFSTTFKAIFLIYKVALPGASSNSSWSAECIRNLKWILSLDIKLVPGSRLSIVMHKTIWSVIMNIMASSNFNKTLDIKISWECKK